MGCAVHVAQSGRDEVGAGRNGPSGRSPKTSQVGRLGLLTSNRIDHPGSVEDLQHRSHGNHTRPHQVIIRENQLVASDIFDRVRFTHHTCEKSESYKPKIHTYISVDDPPSNQTIS